MEPKEAPGRCSYLIEIPDQGLQTTGQSTLFFSLADSKSDPSSYKEDKPDDKKKTEKTKKESGGKDESKKKEPIDLTLELTDRAGNAARVPLSQFEKLQPQIESDVMKASFMTEDATSEVVYQTFEFPLAEFVAANSKIDPTKLASLRLVFDRSEKGVIILDGVGFRP